MADDSITQIFTVSGAEFGAPTERVTFGEFGISIKLDDGNTFIPYTSVDFAVTLDDLPPAEDGENDGTEAA